MIDTIIKEVIAEFGQNVLNEANAAKPDDIGNGSLELKDNGFVISFDGDWAAYYEFGTGTNQTVQSGQSAQEYLSNKPEEVKGEAMKFFKDGKGSIGARPYLYPAILKALNEIPAEIERRVSDYWNNLRF